MIKSSPTRRRRQLFALVAGASLLAACSSGSSGSGTTSGSTAAPKTADSESGGTKNAGSMTDSMTAEPTAESSSGQTSGGGNSSGGVSADKLAEMKKAVQEAQAVPQFKPQGPAFSVADLKGKKIFSMPVASSLTGCDNMSKWVVDLAKSVGMEDSLYFQNDGGPAAWQEGMAQAINGNYDGIALVCGIDPNSIAPQMEAAKAAGIPVIDMHLSDVSVPADPLVTGQTSGEFNLSMKMGVYDALIRSGGEPIDVFMITANENPPSVGMEKTVKDTLAEVCTACTFQSGNVPIPDFFGGAGQSTIDAALVANPDLDAVFLAYDFMAPVVEGAINANNSDARIYAFGADVQVVPTMTSPDSKMGSDMGPDFLWMAYSGADQLFRAMADQPVIPAAEAFAPYRMFTSENAAEKTEEPGSGFGDGYMQGYYDLWLDNGASEPFKP